MPVRGSGRIVIYFIDKYTVLGQDRPCEKLVGHIGPKPE